MNDDTLLSKELDYLTSEARHFVIDSVYAALFNKANDLIDNTAGHDVEWLARELYLWMHTDSTNWTWDALFPQQRNYWYKLATICLDRLPYLMDRIAYRCKVQAEALRSLSQAEHQRKEQLRKELREGH